MTNKVLLTRQGKKFFVRDLENDFHTQYGLVKSSDLKKAKEGELVKTNTGKELFVMSPSFIDLYGRIKRGAQIIPLKDIGVIIAIAGINKESRILDAGAGSGALSCFLASIAKEVITYEIREDFIEIVNANIEFLGLKNIKVKNKNIYEGTDEKDVDAVILDLPEPWLAVESSSKALKAGGFLASYSPSVPQVADFVNALRKNDDFVYLKTIEVTEREWEIEERKVRPKSKGLGHSGFMSFARKIK